MTEITGPAARQPQFRRRPRFITTPQPAELYEIGYGKPPKQHRFKPGQSGNPRGRPKGARGVNAMVREVLEAKTELTIKGRRRKVTFIQALLLKQLELAGKGDWRALAELIKHYRAAVPEPEQRADETVAGAAPNDLEDDAIIEAYKLMVLAEAAADRQVTP